MYNKFHNPENNTYRIIPPFHLENLVKLGGNDVLIYIAGPHTWAVYYPQAAGNGQSPIDIVTTDTIYDNGGTAPTLAIQYRDEDCFDVTNTGESFKVDLKQSSGKNHNYVSLRRLLIVEEFVVTEYTLDSSIMRPKTD